MSLGGRLMYVAKTILGVMRDPTSNLTVAFLVMAIAALALILLLLLVYALVSLRDWEETAAADRTRAGEPSEAARAVVKRRRRLAGIVAGIAVFVLLAAAGAASTNDRTCGRCHYTATAFASRAKGPHASVACARCHVTGGMSGRLLAAVGGARNLAVSIVGRERESGRARVSDATCVSCHRDTARGVMVAQGIRARHSDMTASGSACTDCHNTAGHGEEVLRPRHPDMESCLPCHDGVTASASCETCHVGDPGVAVRRLPRGFKKASLRREDCRGCHSVQSCNECHGLELPHSRKFVEGYHARQAYTDKELCLKCHDMYAFCNKGCHRFRAGLVEGTRVIGEQHDWFRSEHQRKAGPAQCEGCHQNPDMCRYCHDR